MGTMIDAVQDYTINIYIYRYIYAKILMYAIIIKLGWCDGGGRGMSFRKYVRKLA